MDSIETHPLVSALMPDDNGERRVALVGFVGPSNASGTLRLYDDLTFKSYYEIPSEAVKASMPAKANDPNSPTVVILDSKAQIAHVISDRAMGEAAMLAGAISSGHYKPGQPDQAAAAGAAGGLGCCNPTYTIAHCTRGGPTMQGVQCIVVTGTTVCTPTGIPIVCP